MKIGVLTIYVVLIQVGLISHSYLVSLLPLVLMSFTILQILNKDNFTFKQLLNSNLTLMLFALIGCIAIFRSNFIGVDFVGLFIRVLNFLLFIYCFSLICNSLLKNKTDSVKLVIYYIVLPFLLLALTNFLLYAGNVKLLQSALGIDSGTYEAVLLSYLGINISRVEFPLAGGLNNYASYIGGGFLLTLAIIILSKRHKFILYLSAIVFLITLLMIDTRSSLIYPLLIAICIFVVKSTKKISKHLKWLALFVIIGPLIFTVLLPWVSSLPGFEFLERGESDIQTGSGRFFIWLVSISEFASFKLIHLIGYGEYGHFGSGASKQWAPMFKNWAQPQYKSPHNTMFSLLFDYGYLGLVLYISIIWQSIGRIVYMWNIEPILSKVLLSFVLYNIVSGITEVVGGFYFPNYILLFYMTTIIINIQFYIIKKEQMSQLAKTY